MGAEQTGGIKAVLSHLCGPGAEVQGEGCFKGSWHLSHSSRGGRESVPSHWQLSWSLVKWQATERTSFCYRLWIQAGHQRKGWGQDYRNSTGWGKAEYVRQHFPGVFPWPHQAQLLTFWSPGGTPGSHTNSGSWRSACTSHYPAEK